MPRENLHQSSREVEVRERYKFLTFVLDLVGGAPSSSSNKAIQDLMLASIDAFDALTLSRFLVDGLDSISGQKQKLDHKNMLFTSYWSLTSCMESLTYSLTIDGLLRSQYLLLILSELHFSLVVASNSW